MGWADLSEPEGLLHCGLMKRSRLKKIRQATSVRILVDVARSSRTNVLLFLVPVGIALFYADVDPIASFVINILAMIPLAGVPPCGEV